MVNKYPVKAESLIRDPRESPLAGSSLLAKGKQVMVYEDPITKQKPEGMATLLKKLEGGFDGLERWRVRFVNDRYQGPFERWIQE